VRNEVEEVTDRAFDERDEVIKHDEVPLRLSNIVAVRHKKKQRDKPAVENGVGIYPKIKQK
jgi:hypothetical protein